MNVRAPSLLKARSAGEAPPEADGWIEPSRPREEVRQEPYPLPKEFSWSFLDINDPAEVGLSFRLSHRIQFTCSSSSESSMNSSLPTMLRTTTKHSASSILRSSCHGMRMCTPYDPTLIWFLDVSLQGIETTRLLQGMACRSSGDFKSQACRIHFRRSNTSPCSGQVKLSLVSGFRTND